MLIRNLILAAVTEDHPAKPLTGCMVKALITAIKSFGLHFTVFDKAQYEFTSLNGNEKKLLKELRSKLLGCQPPQ